jgi:ABC-type glycerol-3-phosphate transport system substrate-binding protein
MLMPQQHADLADTLDQNSTTNKMSRRSFLHTAFGAGLAGSTLPAIFLGGCSSTSSGKIELQWVSSGNISFGFLVEIFNATNQDNIHVTELPGDTFNVNQKFGKYRYLTTQLAEQKTQPDIMSLDVIWMKEFATRGWIYPLDQYWHDTLNTDDYLQKPLEAVRFKIAKDQPELWGAPHHTDAGILYYRTDMPDIISLDPAKPWTWDDIKQMCKQAKAGGRPGIFAW